MKSTLLILALLITATAQSQAPDTTIRVHLSQTDIWQIRNNINAALQKIHSTHMDAMRRDSIDLFLGGIPAVIEERYRRGVDSLKKGGKKQ